MLSKKEWYADSYDLLRSFMIKKTDNYLHSEITELILKAYFKAFEIEVGILLNFGKRTEFKRRVLTAEYKNLNKS